MDPNILENLLTAYEDQTLQTTYQYETVPTPPPLHQPQHHSHITPSETTQKSDTNILDNDNPGDGHNIIRQLIDTQPTPMDTALIRKLQHTFHPIRYPTQHLRIHIDGGGKSIRHQ